MGLALPLGIPLAARADDYPRLPINVVTPLSPGDAADRAARLMGQELSRLLGTSVLVVNRPGAGGSLGVQSVIRAPKDGYTLLFAQNSPLTIRRLLEPETADYDPLKDLTPLALTTRSPSVLIVNKDAPFTTLKELIAHASKASDSVRIGNAGPGSVGDISVQSINAAAGIAMSSITYKGAAPAVTDVLGGHIDGAILALGAVSAQIRSNGVRALAISSSFSEFPTVPTLRQMGFKSDLLGVWFGFLMPAGVPRAVVDKLMPALEKAARSPSLAAQLLPAGIVQEWRSSSGLSDEIREEYRSVGQLLATRPRGVK